MVCHSLLQWTTFCQNSPPWPVQLGRSHSMAHSFTELDKAVVHVIDWLVFCEYGFQSVSPLMEKDKRLMKASWQDRLRGDTGSSSDGRGHVPSLLFTWGQTMVEVMNIMVTSFKRSHACTATLSAPNPAAGHNISISLSRVIPLSARGKVCRRRRIKHWTWLRLKMNFGGCLKNHPR